MPFPAGAIAKLAGGIALPAVIALVQPKVAGQANPEFEVASVKLDKTNDPPFSNFPLGPGDVYVPNGGLFSARGLPLVTYLFFAYKIIGNQAQSLLPQLPEWAKTDRYNIQARAEGNPGKEQMRMMMRSLLADRFGLKMHSEMREVPVLAFVLAKPGKMGPQLWPHTGGAPCPTEAAPSMKGPVPTDARGLPALCNGIFPLPPSAPGRMKIGARSVTLQFLADSLSALANLGRPMIDRTGLTGPMDFLLEFVRERTGPLEPGAAAPPEVSGPTLMEALREQLGIKLESAKSELDVLVLDRVERPSEN
jgi:uncharacterized protein (TIGR03435 family)